MDLTTQILFAKGNDTVIIPTKREEDGAFDIYANFSEDYMIIKPHETKMIPTGLHSAFSSDYVAILKERGSTGSKGIGQRCGVIDSGFRGEWFVPLTNHNEVPIIIAKESSIVYGTMESYDSHSISDRRYFVRVDDVTKATAIDVDSAIPYELNKIILYPYEKAIAQCMMVEVPKLTTVEATMEEVMSIKSERGTGALGSTTK